MQFQLAQAATELEAARLMVYNAARLKDAGQPFAQEGRDGQALRVAGGRARDVAVRSSCSADTATPRNTRPRSSTATPRSARSTRARRTCSCRRSRSCCSNEARGAGVRRRARWRGPAGQRWKSIVAPVPMSHTIAAAMYPCVREILPVTESPMPAARSARGRSTSIRPAMMNKGGPWPPGRGSAGAQARAEQCR